MRTLVAALCFSLFAPALARAAAWTPAKIKATVKADLKPNSVWAAKVPSSYKVVAVSKLTGGIAKTATGIKQVADTFQIRQRSFGASKVYVIDSSVDDGEHNGFERSVFDAKGKPLFE